MAAQDGVGPAVVVTGVSSGIGWGTARVLARRGLHVFGSVRRVADAERLAAELGAAFTPLFFDVTDAAAVRAAAQLVRERLGARTLLGLVNNAGIAVPGPLMHQPIDDYRRQLEVNLVAPLLVTQAFLPLLGADRARVGRPGRIVNISSVGGRVATPFIGGYVASKHGLEGLSDSLRRELMLYGIDVIVVEPGAVETPIWEKAAAVDVSAYERTDYGPALLRFRDAMLNDSARLTPERVGETVWRALTSPRPRVRYVLVPRRLGNWTLPRLLPERVLDRMVARALGLLREERDGG